MLFLEDRGFVHRPTSEITPRSVYAGRRGLLKLLATGAAGTMLAAWGGGEALAQVARPGKLAALAGARTALAGATTTEKLTPYREVTTLPTTISTSSAPASPILQPVPPRCGHAPGP